MSEATIAKIADFSKDERKSWSLEVLMDYYGVSNLLQISEEMGFEFLAKLESGEIIL